MILPPVPLFPKALDTDYTLFAVYDTAETILAKENAPWAKEIEIVPVNASKSEIWADNGFGNIDGELFYYDAVEKNDDGKVIKLKRCMRQLGGTHTKYNPRGTSVRGFVIAEHHNQLVECILKTEDFIGYNYDTRQATLDWRIRNLEALNVIFDDYNCPDVIFTLTIVEDDPETGILATYVIEPSLPNATFTFRLDFGDGTYTTSALSGQHQYAPNAIMDPVATLTNDQCEVIQTPVERLTPKQLPTVVSPALEVTIPESLQYPDFTLVPCTVPEPDINLPPLVMPCVSVTPGFSIPSINIPSQVTITGPSINMPYSTINITGGGINIPSFIDMPPIPPTIIVEPPIPPTIVIVPPNSNVMLELNPDTLPPLQVDWGSPPQVNFVMTRPVTSQKFAVDPKTVNEFGVEFADLFEASSKMKLEYEPVGIPEEIKILPPSEMPDIRLDVSRLPEKIMVDTTEARIPSEIRIFGPESPIPDSIRLDGIPIPERIDIVHDIPRDIRVESTIPSTIELRGADQIPHKIDVALNTPIPNTIKIEHNIPHHITLDSIPHTIEVKGFPEGIQLLPPETMPPVEMVYRGSPIEVKITMDEILGQSTEKGNCVMIVPCSH
jgi:hypothetical protein